MKKIFLLFIITNTLLFGQSHLPEKNINNFHSIPPSIPYEDSTYMPLRIGNIYQYIYSYSAQQGYWGDFKVHIAYGKVLSDTLINNYKYYLYSIDDSVHWYRYSKEDNKLFELLSGNDLIYMDFNLATGDTFTHLNNYYPAVIFEGDTTLFGYNLSFKGFRQTLGPSVFRREHFAKGLGIFQYYQEGILPPRPKTIISLIMAILNDSTGNTYFYTNHFKPEISLTPITKISSNLFNLNFTVKHKYNIYPAPPPFPWSEINFIDSVKFISYYSKEDSVINLPIVISNRVGIYGQYEVNTLVDSMLLRNGFTFNYKIFARDKGLISETSTSPDSGYYQCVWDFNTSVGNETQPVEVFELHQNYPNPFNPSTVIGYQLPVAGDVTLKVYDVLGREVATLVDEFKDAGYHKVEFNVAQVSRPELASGIYFYRLRTGNYIATKKMVVVR